MRQSNSDGSVHSFDTPYPLFYCTSWPRPTLQPHHTLHCIVQSIVDFCRTA